VKLNYRLGTLAFIAFGSKHQIQNLKENALKFACESLNVHIVSSQVFSGIQVRLQNEFCFLLAA
jgi:hypothetical protein